jgi:hypothetical protein
MTLVRRQVLRMVAGAVALPLAAGNTDSHAYTLTTNAGAGTVLQLTDPTYGEFGNWNLNNGTQGPYWVSFGVWNSVTAHYTCNYVNGSTTVSGFASTAGILVGMSCFSYPAATSTAPWPTVVSVTANSIVLSSPATINSTGNQTQFGLRKGVDYNESITVYPATFPNGTVLNWSFPNQFNDSNVYAFPNLTYGSTGWYWPTNKPTPMKVGSFTNLSVTYNITGNFGTDDADCMFECWSSTATPISPATMTNEISFMCYTPSYMARYILSLAKHFNYSAGGFNAYVGQTTATPPQTMIMPVTAPSGTIPLDLMSGTHTVPVLAVLRELVAQGWLSSSNYISGMEFGVEPRRNSGSLIFNSITWTWN